MSTLRRLFSALSRIQTVIKKFCQSKPVTTLSATAQGTTKEFLNGGDKTAQGDRMDELVAYAYSLVGVPYIYASNCPVFGLDCSGFACEILRFAGILGREDLSAQGIYDMLYKQASTPNLRSRGCFAFYGDSVTKINHVAFLVSPYQVIEAGGGDSTTTSKDEAIKRNAFVRGRLLEHRSDLVATLKPRYGKIGAY